MVTVRGKTRIAGKGELQAIRPGRQDVHGGRSNWTQKHRVWLRKLRRELDGPLGTVLAHHLEHLEHLEGQKDSLEAEIDRYAKSKPPGAKVETLCCFRGVKTLTAMTILTELADIKRFARPTGLMAFAGLVPSERSSGNVQRRGSISKSGSHELRRVLVEGCAPENVSGPAPATGRA